MNKKIFYMTEEQAENALLHSSYGFDCEEGWYWQSFGGDPMGPFQTEKDAKENAHA